MSGASWIRGQPRERQASAPARAASGRTTSAPTREGRFNDALVAELLIEDLPDEAVDRDGIEADVGGRDHSRVDDLALGQLLQDALEMTVSVPLLASDPELLAFERDPPRVPEAEDPRDEALVHQLGLFEHLAVGRAAAHGGDHEPRRHLDAPADLHRMTGLIVLGADEDIGQHVVAGDDARYRLAHHPRLVEDVAEKIEILPVVGHAGECTSGMGPRPRPSAGLPAAAPAASPA